MSSGFYKIALLAAALSAPATMARAQETGERATIIISPDFDRADVAGMRNEPAFAPRSIQLGGFNIEASLATIAAYDSNVRKRSTQQGDASLTLTPRLRARTDLDRLQVRLGATGIFRRYASLDSENTEEFDLNAAISTDVAQSVSFSTNASYSRESEPRSSVGSPGNAAEPVDANELVAGAGVTFALGKLRISPSVRYTERTYEDLDIVAGAPQDLSFRDTRAYRGALSVGYQLSPVLTVFTTANYDDVESVNAAPGAQRDSTGFSLYAGVRGELSSLVIAEIAAGYRKRDYDLARYRDTSRATYRANVQWFATSLMSFRLQASQRFVNSGRADVAGILATQIAASAYYDPLRNVRLGSTISYTRNDFRDVDTTANRATVRLQAQYFLNRNLALGAYAKISRQDVSGTPLVGSFTSYSTGLGIILTP